MWVSFPYFVSYKEHLVISFPVQTKRGISRLKSPQQNTEPELLGPFLGNVCSTNLIISIFKPTFIVFIVNFDILRLAFNRSAVSTLWKFCGSLFGVQNSSFLCPIHCIVTLYQLLFCLCSDLYQDEYWLGSLQMQVWTNFVYLQQGHRRTQVAWEMAKCRLFFELDALIIVLILKVIIWKI